MSKINEQLRNEHFLYSNCGLLYRMPSELLEKYILSYDEQEGRDTFKEVVFDEKEIYEVPSHILYDYIVSEEEKLQIRSELLSLKIEEIDPVNLDKICLFVFDYLALSFMEEVEVSGYGSSIDIASEVNKKLNTSRLSKSQIKTKATGSQEGRDKNISTAKDTQKNITLIKNTLQDRSLLSSDALKAKESGNSVDTLGDFSSNLASIAGFTGESSKDNLLSHKEEKSASASTGKTVKTEPDGIDRQGARDMAQKFIDTLPPNLRGPLKDALKKTGQSAMSMGDAARFLCSMDERSLMLCLQPLLRSGIKEFEQLAHAIENARKLFKNAFQNNNQEAFNLAMQQIGGPAGLIEISSKLAGMTEYHFEREKDGIFFDKPFTDEEKEKVDLRNDVKDNGKRFRDSLKSDKMTPDLMAQVLGSLTIYGLGGKNPNIVKPVVATNTAKNTVKVVEESVETVEKVILKYGDDADDFFNTLKKLKSFVMKNPARIAEIGVDSVGIAFLIIEGAMIYSQMASKSPLM